jgi:hypothetical protein
MTTLKNTKENNAKVSALKTIKQTKWVGEITHDTLDKALTAINLFQGMNSGWYTPKAVRLSGVQGIFMVNEDGTLHFSSRVIKLEKKVYKIEHLSSAGYKEFEERFFEALDA